MVQRHLEERILAPDVSNVWKVVALYRSYEIIQFFDLYFRNTSVIVTSENTESNKY